MDISPDKQNVDELFGNTAYHIDFYQRDYKWTNEPVQRLMDDIFYTFDSVYEAEKALDPSSETVSAKYPWYYLSTYVTNTIDGRVYVVDGQQRLTTLTLILIALYQLSNFRGSKLKGWISSKIAGQAGYQTLFWMNHERHSATLQALFEDLQEVPTETGVTAENMSLNFTLIKTCLQQKLVDIHQLETFVFFFLRRLVLVNLAVEQTDVPMIFEVINDRGVKLRPYEILKGKLLGQIDKIELESGEYNEKWESYVKRVNQHAEDEIDVFFTYFLKAKFSDTRSTGQRFDTDYHREIFKPDLNAILGLERSASKVKSFISQDMNYYTALYDRLLCLAYEEEVGYEAVFYNRLNGMDSQYQLIIASCLVGDVEEDLKIREVARGVDRLFSLLQLQRSYDSNEFADAVYEISAQIRGVKATDIAHLFEKKLIFLLSKRRLAEATTSFDYGQFRNTSITDMPTRFTRYLFARIDRFIAVETNTGERQDFEDLVTKTGVVNGFHIEHILSRNEESLKAFGDDDERFEAERNRMGGVLLLKGKDNISSGNELYAQKLKSYAKTLHWNESLRDDSYKSKKDFNGFMSKWGLKFEPFAVFGPSELEKRQTLLYEMARIIWEQ